MIRIAALAILGLIAACDRDETLSGYGAAGRTWSLTELSGAPFDARATLRFPETGLIAGDAPCNTYSTSLTVPYPWFGIGPIQATKTACPDLEAEAAFFTSLAAMSQAEVLGDVLILRDDDGQEMVFSASD